MNRFGLLSLTLFVSLALPMSAGAGTVDLYPSDNVPALVDDNPAGTTFVFTPGIYRLQGPITGKNGDVFSGQSGAILSGSKLLSSFSKETLNSVTYWVADGPTVAGELNSECDNSFPMCRYPENLYIDGTPLLRASSLSSVTTGTCYYDYSAGKIYFLQNPSGHTVETSSTPFAFMQGPSNITIQGLIIEEFATPGQFATVGYQSPGANWTVQNNEIRLNHSEGLRVGNGGKVLNNYIHDNGQLGVAVFDTTTAVLVQNNEIARNNWAGFRITFEAGGAKFGGVVDLTAEGNYIHDNQGNGMWCDGYCSGGVYENNTIENNAKNGLFHEVSHSWTMLNNVISGNGFGTSWGEWMGGTGVEIDESDHVEVASNFVANNYRAIVMDMSPRPGYTADLNNNYVHNNTVVTGGVNGLTGVYQVVGNNDYYTTKNNRFANDTYCMPSSSRGYYWWMDNYQTTTGWKGYGQDVDGTWACPGVYLSSPSSGATVSGKVSISAAAADITSVSKVEFYVDGTVVDTDTSDPYAYTWDTTGYANGTYTIEARAYNAAGESATSSVTVTVKNP